MKKNFKKISLLIFIILCTNINFNVLASTSNDVEVLKQGEYIISSNIWFSKEVTKLPLNPHITNPEFPPHVPMIENSKLIVGSDGRAIVTIPIQIKDDIIKVKDIRGLEIIDKKMNEENSIKQISVDMGILSSENVEITKEIEADIEMGEIALSISGLEKEHTWPATFQLNLSKVSKENGETLEIIEIKDGIETDKEIVENIKIDFDINEIIKNNETDNNSILIIIAAILAVISIVYIYKRKSKKDKE